MPKMKLIHIMERKEEKVVIALGNNTEVLFSVVTNLLKNLIYFCNAVCHLESG